MTHKMNIQQLFRGLLPMILLLVILPACKDLEEKPVLQVATEQLVFAREGGRDHFFIRCAGDWQIIHPNADWFTISERQGHGDRDIEVKAMPASKGVSRRVTLTVKSGSAQDGIIISQQAAEVFTLVGPTEYKADAEGKEEVHISVDAGVPYRVEPSASWVTLLNQKVGGFLPKDPMVKLKISPNFGSNPRTARVHFTPQKETLPGFVVTIVQAGGAPPSGEAAVGSNCYMIQPETVEKIALARVNAFWNLPGYGNPEKTLKSDDEWVVSLLWQDTPEPLVRFVNDEGKDVTVLEGRGAADGAYFSIRSLKAEGNAVIAIRRKGTEDQIGNYLWSWHIWVTRYNPNVSILTPQAGKYFYDVPGGKVHRYGGADWETGAYAKTFIMDRNLGARTELWKPEDGRQGQLFYQFGRKDPFCANGSTSVTLYDVEGKPLEKENPKNVATNHVYNKQIQKQWQSIAFVVQHPTIYISGNPLSGWAKDIQLPPTPWHSPYPNLALKSFYDPCPMGWQVPEPAIWNDFDLEKNVTIRQDGQAQALFSFFYAPQGNAAGGERVFYPGVGSRKEILNLSPYGVRLYSNEWMANKRNHHAYILRASYGKITSAFGYIIDNKSKAKKHEALPIRCIRKK